MSLPNAQGRGDPLGGMLMHLQGIALSNCSLLTENLQNKTLASDCNLNEDLTGQ